MGKRIKYTKGEEVGSCFYLYDVEVYVMPNGRTQRRALFICKCGNEFISAVYYVKSGHTKSCGCLMNKMLIDRNTKHGLTQHDTFKIWMGIKTRCYNKNAQAYMYYGARGITMCDEWLNDFRLFYDYVTDLEYYGMKGYSIDRINNNGNYEPGNIRWADQHIQAVNSRMKISNTTGYIGVSMCNGMYQSKICVNGDNIYLGTYKTKRESLDARNEYIIDNKLFEYKIQEYHAQI